MTSFDLNAKGFSLENALECAKFSELAYDPPSTGVTAINSPLAHALIIECENARVVPFRGTKGVVDLITDAKYCMKDLGNGVKVHHGFDDGVQSIYSPLVNALKDLPPKPLFFMGHSYGGACAVRFADLWDERRELRGDVDQIVGVYTFGQPRVYNRAGAMRYDARLGSRTIRAVFENDLIARIPIFPAPLILNLHSPYWHCGQEIFLPVTGGTILNPSLLQLLASDLMGFYIAYRNGGVVGAIEDPIADHGVAKNYVAALTSLLVAQIGQQQTAEAA